MKSQLELVTISMSHRSVENHWLATSQRQSLSCTTRGLSRCFGNGTFGTILVNF